MSRYAVWHLVQCVVYSRADPRTCPASFPSYFLVTLGLGLGLGFGGFWGGLFQHGTVIFIRFDVTVEPLPLISLRVGKKP